MTPTSARPKRKPLCISEKNSRLLLLAGVAIVLAALGYPAIRAEHHRLSKMNAGSAFKTEFMAKLSGNPRFPGLTVMVDTGGGTSITGAVDSPEAYADLNVIVLSCKREVPVSLNIYYPHKLPDIDKTFVFSDNELIPPGN